MDDSVANMLVPVLLFAVGILSLIGLIISIGYIQDKQMPTKENVSLKHTDNENLKTSVKMLIGFMSKGMGGRSDRYDECFKAGCTGSSILSNSSDLAKLVKLVHLSRGRLVVRKVSDSDIDKHSIIEVKRILSALDISRAKRIHKIKR